MGDEEITSLNITELTANDLTRLRVEHRRLDEEIERLQIDGGDQLYLRRLKKQKLVLKDAIQRLRSDLIPDIDA